MTQIFVSVGITDPRGSSIILESHVCANYQPITETEVQTAKKVRKHTANFIMPSVKNQPARLFWAIYDGAKDLKPRRTSANYPEDLS